MEVTKQKEFKSILEAERDKHQTRAQALNSDKTREKGAISADSSEAAIDIENDEVVDGLEALELKQINLLNAAIQRVESGTFGTCLECGEEITEARLKAVPSSPNCINCSE